MFHTRTTNHILWTKFWKSLYMYKGVENWMRNVLTDRLLFLICHGTELFEIFNLSSSKKNYSITSLNLFALLTITHPAMETTVCVCVCVCVYSAAIVIYQMSHIKIRTSQVERISTRNVSCKPTNWGKSSHIMTVWVEIRVNVIVYCFADCRSSVMLLWPGCNEIILKEILQTFIFSREVFPLLFVVTPFCSFR